MIEKTRITQWIIAAAFVWPPLCGVIVALGYVPPIAAQELKTIGITATCTGYEDSCGFTSARDGSPDAVFFVWGFGQCTFLDPLPPGSVVHRITARPAVIGWNVYDPNDTWKQVGLRHPWTADVVIGEWSLVETADSCDTTPFMEAPAIGYEFPEGFAQYRYGGLNEVYLDTRNSAAQMDTYHGEYLDLEITYTPPSQVTFLVDDPLSPDEFKVLLSKGGSTDSYPATGQQLLPAPADGKIRVDFRAHRGDLSLSFKPLYLRVQDPADRRPPSYPSYYGMSYYNLAPAPGDNSGTTYSLAESVLLTNADGRASVVLDVGDAAAGDNYKVQAFFTEPAENGQVCLPPDCWESDIYTTWKRIYLEKDQMFKVGSYISEGAVAGAVAVRLSNPQIVSPGDVIRLIHQDEADTWWEDVVVKAEKGKAAKDDLIALETPLQYSYDSDAQDIRRSDAVGVITAVGAPMDDSTWPARVDLLEELFGAMFVDLDLSADPLPLLPAEPNFSPGLGSSATDARVLAEKYFYGQNLPNHVHLLTAGKVANLWGESDSKFGSNASWIFVGSINETFAATPFSAPEHAANAEAVVHEITHLFQVNPLGDGHCGESRSFENSSEYCQMHSPWHYFNGTSQSVFQYYHDWKIFFHDYSDPYSEYRWIRERSDPLPLIPEVN